MVFNSSQDTMVSLDQRDQTRDALGLTWRPFSQGSANGTTSTLAFNPRWAQLRSTDRRSIHVRENPSVLYRIYFGCFLALVNFLSVLQQANNNHPVITVHPLHREWPPARGWTTSSTSFCLSSELLSVKKRTPAACSCLEQSGPGCELWTLRPEDCCGVVVLIVRRTRARVHREKNNNNRMIYIWQFTAVENGRKKKLGRCSFVMFRTSVSFGLSLVELETEVDKCPRPW